MLGGDGNNDDPLCFSATDLLLAAFPVAETAAEEMIELILEECGKKLYRKYIERKSYSFAADTVVDLLVAEVQMCFVRHDPGEPSMSVGDLGSNGQPAFSRQTSIGDRSASSASASQQVSPSATIVVSVPHVSETLGPDDASTRPHEEILTQPLHSADAEGAAVLAADTDMAVSVAEGAASPSVERKLQLTLKVPAVEGEVSCASWSLESEPQRCRIDTWARSCVPVQRKFRSKHKAVLDVESSRKTPLTMSPARTTRRLSKKLSTHSISRTPSRMHAADSTGDSSKAGSKNYKDGMIPLVENVVQDEEEAVLREMKDREAKKKREEEMRLQRKAAEEADRAAHLAQVKDQMKNKPYTYDSEGGIIWVQPVHAEKLPNATPSPHYTLRREATAEDRHHEHRRFSKGHNRLEKKRTNPKLKEMEFVDTFKKFSSQQPSMMEAMKMAAGVHLNERGITKTGDDLNSGAGQAGGRMTRRQYEAKVKKEGGATTTGTVGASENKDNEKGLAIPSPAQFPKESLGAEVLDEVVGENSLTAKSKTKLGGEGALRPVGSAAVMGIVPQPPSPRRVEQPPPPAARSLHINRGGLAFYGQSPRERVQTGTGSRFPSCGKAPLLGATMGHGIIPQSSKHEEYYFPKADSGYAAADDAVESVSASMSPPPAAGSARSRQGLIVSQNPELARKLFNRFNS